MNKGIKINLKIKNTFCSRENAHFENDIKLINPFSSNEFDK